MPRYTAPAGKVVKGWVVRLEPTPEQAAKFRRDCGARRFAYNWAVTAISESFNVGQETGDYDRAVWSMYSLRKRWNQVKGEVAPWWAENSKWAYEDGIASAVTGLKNWHDSRTGKRKGPKTGFPHRKKKAKDQLRCTYSADSGRSRIEGSRTVVLPGVGRVCTAENIRALWRHVRRGTGRVLSVTVREKAGRWSASLRLEITAPRQPSPRIGTVGVDVGIGNNLLIVMHPDGAGAEKVPNPRALRASLAELRLAHRALSRKQEGSTRWRKAKRRLGRVHARTVDTRKDAIHKATTRLAKTHGVVVIEDLAVSGHMRALRSHRKAWTDAAAGELRRQLTYKADWYRLTLADRRWACPECGTVHDRDENAGVNLARLPASQAEALSGRKTGLARQPAVKRVNHLRKVA